jgi:eukaryotic-like serine/threonine-protein kinase
MASSESGSGIGVGFSDTDTVTSNEEGRAFFQARLSIFGFCMFVLAGGSWLALALAYYAKPSNDAHDPFSFGGLLHLVNALLVGGLWLATRRGQRRGKLLHALDIGVTVGLLAIWAISGATMPGAVVAGFVALLSFVVGMLARAIVVPSTYRRTLALGVVGAALLVAASLWRGVTEHGVLGSTVAAACWATTAVVLASVASRTIFGLRREVSRAHVLGQYTLESKLGEGGMGVVWRARHALLRRPTAVKLLQPGRSGGLASKRFEREVQLSALLTHPNSVAIYDYGRTRDGIFYYAMELLEGTDLEHLVNEHGRQPAGRVVHVLTQVCGALAEAHDLGLVHRDVKPANILLSPRPNEHEIAKVADYGLVKSIEAEPAQGAITNVNTIFGTPLYMSPEAILTPDEVDGRSDLYALGAVAWFMLVGRTVFEGQSVVEVCAQHLHQPAPRPSEVLGVALPRDLEEIVLACLEKKRDARPADARALRERLLSCSAAGAWSAAQAAEFWRARGAGLARPAAERSASHQPLTLEIGGRSQLELPG